jgi:hypothetical protein
VWSRLSSALRFRVAPQKLRGGEWFAPRLAAETDMQALKKRS